MDWIKKHTDQFALALMALVLVALSVLVFLKAQSFGEGFSAARTSPPHSKEVPKVDTTLLEGAQKEFVAPKTWQPTEKTGSLFVSWKLVVDPKSRMVLDGTEIDFVTGLMGSGFKFNNPNVRHSCACGESFSA